MSALHQSKCISKSGPPSLRDVWAEYEINYLMCQILTKILEHHVIPNSSNQNLKISKLQKK